MSRPIVRECDAGCGAKLIFERTVAGKWAPLEWPGEPREVFLGDKCPDCYRSLDDHGPAAALYDMACARSFPGRERRSLIGTAGVVIEWTYPKGSGGKPVRAFVSHFIGCPERDRFRRKPARAGRREQGDG